MYRKGMSSWIWLLIILALLGIGIWIYFWMSGSDGGISSILNSGSPQPPALPE